MQKLNGCITKLVVEKASLPDAIHNIQQSDNPSFYASCNIILHLLSIAVINHLISYIHILIIIYYFLLNKRL